MSGLLLLSRKALPRESGVLFGNEAMSPASRAADADDVSIAVGTIGFLGGGLLIMSLWAKHPVWGFILGSVLGSNAATLVNAGISRRRP